MYGGFRIIMSRIIKIVDKTTKKLPEDSDEVIESLYEVSPKVYLRSVSGVFAQWRIAMVIITQLIYYGLPWIVWKGRQAVLFDLVARKFYIFGLVYFVDMPAHRRFIPKFSCGWSA